MIIFIDYNKLFCYIVAPKCGNTTIANHLNLHLLNNYDNFYKILGDEKFTKILVLRSIYSRFLSGFYEDLFNNNCYNDIDTTFNKYLLFLKKITDDKEKNIVTIQYYYKQIKPIYWGQCSNVKLPITNDNGTLWGHIRGFKHSVEEYVKNSNNIKLLDINNLSNFLDSHDKKNVKKKNYNSTIGSTRLSCIKKKKLIINEKKLTQKQKDIIDHIYKEDFEYIKYLKNTYEYIEISKPSVIETLPLIVENKTL